jgi:hypothetical protein
MRRMTLLATMVLIALACGTAHAANWVSLGKTADGSSEILVEVSRIRIEGDVRHAWTRRVLAPQVDKGVGRYAKSRVTQYLTRYAVNCRDETRRPESTAIFFDYGTSWYWSADGSAKPWEPVAPGSVESKMMRFVCTWTPN